jgi:hypothetical protein
MQKWRGCPPRAQDQEGRPDGRIGEWGARLLDSGEEKEEKMSGQRPRQPAEQEADERGLQQPDWTNCQKARRRRGTFHTRRGICQAEVRVS